MSASIWCSDVSDELGKKIVSSPVTFSETEEFGAILGGDLYRRVGNTSNYVFIKEMNIDSKDKVVFALGYIFVLKYKDQAVWIYDSLNGEKIKEPESVALNEIVDLRYVNDISIWYNFFYASQRTLESPYAKNKPVKNYPYYNDFDSNDNDISKGNISAACVFDIVSDDINNGVLAKTCLGPEKKVLYVFFFGDKVIKISDQKIAYLMVKEENDRNVYTEDYDTKNLIHAEIYNNFLVLIHEKPGDDYQSAIVFDVSQVRYFDFTPYKGYFRSAKIRKYQKPHRIFMTERYMFIVSNDETTIDEYDLSYNNPNIPDTQITINPKTILNDLNINYEKTKELIVNVNVDEYNILIQLVNGVLLRINRSNKDIVEVNPAIDLSDGQTMYFELFIDNIKYFGLNKPIVRADPEDAPPTQEIDYPNESDGEESIQSTKRWREYVDYDSDETTAD